MTLEELICRARAGDGEAFTALMEGQKQTLYKVARSYLRSDADAADAIGDTVLSCWEKLSTLRQPEYFRTWLVRILIRKCQDILRQRRRVIPLEEAPVGDYLPKTGYVWQVGEYTLTVESYLLDEHTGAGRVYFTLERPGGVEGLAVSSEDGETWADGTGVALNFCVLDEDGAWRAVSGRFYADQSRSTEEKLCLTAALGAETGWKTSDGLRIRFLDLRRNQGSEKDVSLVAELELPGVDSLPAVSVADPVAGEELARVSAIGMLIRTPDVDQVERVALEYADGTSYVVCDRAADLDNTEYALSWTRGEGQGLTLVFNRLADPDQVRAVTVDGVRYSVE